MQSAILGLSLCLLGVDVGWQPLKTGGVEYIIQINPQELDIVRLEGGIESSVPARLRDIRQYRILIGTKVLPQIDPPVEKPSDHADAGPKEPAGGGKAAKEHKAPPAGKPEETTGWWWPLGLMLGLLGSLGGNVYLGWITWETRARYRALLRRRRKGDQQPAIDDFPEG